MISLAKGKYKVDEVAQDCGIKKNKVNHERQESGYAVKNEADSKHI